MLFRSFDLIHQSNIMIPSNLCKCRLHNFLVRKTQSKLRHIFQISHRVAGGVRKRNFNVGGKIFNKFVAPCLVLVDDLADGVVENQQLSIDADCRTVLRRADRLLDLDSTMLGYSLELISIFFSSMVKVCSGLPEY